MRGYGIMYAWGNNVLDNGQRSLKPEELKKENCRGKLQVIFPNYWQNIITDGLRVVAAFGPVDDENTKIYNILSAICEGTRAQKHCDCTVHPLQQESAEPGQEGGSHAKAYKKRA
ncbi:MAG: hypothetical protein ACP5T1_06730 [Thermoplasmata archaeon]